MAPERMPEDRPGTPAGEQHIVVVGPDGQPVGTPAAVEQADPQVADLVEQPAKVMRIGSMIKQLLDEVKESPLDEAARTRLRHIHQRSIQELEDGLAPELIEELERLSLPFTDDGVPSDAELRIAQAQLVGWLEGLFHGIQTALFAQQMAARAAFDQVRRRAIDTGQPGNPPASPGIDPGRGSGPYL